jgi:hypothetical protein
MYLVLTDSSCPANAEFYYFAVAPWFALIAIVQRPLWSCRI